MPSVDGGATPENVRPEGEHHLVRVARLKIEVSSTSSAVALKLDLEKLYGQDVAEANKNAALERIHSAMDTTAKEVGDVYLGLLVDGSLPESISRWIRNHLRAEVHGALAWVWSTTSHLSESGLLGKPEHDYRLWFDRKREELCEREGARLDPVVAPLSVQATSEIDLRSKQPSTIGEGIGPSPPPPLLEGWKALCDAVGFKPRRWRILMELCKKHKGPVRMGGSGHRPRASKAEFIAWWNSLRQKQLTTAEMD
jgi:hypothetical protein